MLRLIGLVAVIAVGAVYFGYAPALKTGGAGVNVSVTGPDSTEALAQQYDTAVQTHAWRWILRTDDGVYVAEFEGYTSDRNHISCEVIRRALWADVKGGRTDIDSAFVCVQQ